jgi:hypothetical protein
VVLTLDSLVFALEEDEEEALLLAMKSSREL